MSQKWICADPDSSQYVRMIDRYKYELIEARECVDKFRVVTAIIDHEQYLVEEVEEYLKYYDYNSLQQVTEIYGIEDAPKIVSECIFENLDYAEVELLGEFKSFDYAEKFIRRIICSDTSDDIHLVKTSAGSISVCPYDDVCAKGIYIKLDGDIVAMLDVYEPQAGETEGEARVLVYAHDDDEPTECISLNR